MLKLNPISIYNTGYIIDHPNPEYKVRELGDRILDELYEENDIIACETGIILLGCCIPLGCDIIDLYHDIYHLYKSLNGSIDSWEPKNTLQVILQSCTGYLLYSHIEYFSYVYDYRFIKYVINLVMKLDCTINDLRLVVMRRSLQQVNETYTTCTINALGWLDNESYWFLKRNTHIGLTDAIKSLGCLIPYGMRYDDYIHVSYMSSMIHERSPIEPFLENQPTTTGTAIIEFTMKDTEILNKYGMLPRYSSKNELIELLREIKYNRMYEIHIKDKYYGRETSINMDIIDSNTRELFMIDNNLYTLDELVQVCENDMKFDKYPICKELAEDLLYFMDHYGEIDVCNIISKYIDDCRDIIVSMKKNVMNDMMFKKFLIYIIEVGLYARRWRGHGHPYPYKSNDTDNIGNKLFISRMNSLNIKIMNIVNSEEFVWYRDHIMLHKSSGSMRKRFIPYYIAMIDGKECIRLMSESLIYTGCYYLQVIYDCKYQDNVGNILDTNLLEFMNPISPEERT